MKKFKIRFVLNGQHTETVMHAPSESQAVSMAKSQYPRATSVYALQVR